MVFKSKKSTLDYYKNILNKYNYEDYLDEVDFNDVNNLLKKHPDSINKIGNGVKAISIGKVRTNTKCFKIIRNDLTSETFSYFKCINGNYSALTQFNRVCRDVISDDIQKVKQDYFDRKVVKGKVKCQETGELCSWEDLVIDHRQPQTFSMIVDRFIELYQIDIDNIDYYESEDGIQTFKDEKITSNFKAYHKEKANLRIVKKNNNSRRAYQARIKQQQKDLKIK